MMISENEFIAGKPLYYTGLSGDRQAIARFKRDAALPYVEISEHGRVVMSPVMAEHEARTFYSGIARDNAKPLPEWRPVQGYLNSGRFDYGTRYTIRKPSHHIKDSDGRIVGVIQRLSGDDAVIQWGTDKPRTLTSSLLYHLTGYGNGVDSDSPDYIRKAFLSAMSYICGPWSAVGDKAESLTVTPDLRESNA